MLDNRKLRNRVLLKLAASPLTLVPFVLGATLLAGALAFSYKLGMLAFGGLACVLGAAGIALTRFLLGGESLAQDAIAELQEEAKEKRELRLNELDQRLVEDRDERTEAALRDLRAFEEAFRDRETWASHLNAASAFDILTGTQELFNGCVLALEKSIDLWETAHRLRTPEARQPILDRREEIIRDVQGSIEQLSRLLVGVQELGSQAASDTDLSRIRKDLDANLAIARRVEEKLRTWQESPLDRV